MALYLHNLARSNLKMTTFHEIYIAQFILFYLL